MAIIENKKEKEVRAILGDLRMSPRKVRLVTDLIKNKSVARALLQLQFLNKKAARPVLKLVNSAVANARNNFQLNPSSLLVKRIFVDQGISLKRFKPRAQGRALPIEHRTSRVTIVLVEDQKLAKIPQTRVVSQDLRKDEAKQTEHKTTATDDQKKKPALPETRFKSVAKKQGGWK